MNPSRMLRLLLRPGIQALILLSPDLAIVRRFKVDCPDLLTLSRSLECGSKLPFSLCYRASAFVPRML